ncbi:MAG TPA: hypothetical protein VGS27_07990 [Candidatus Sulfotelmatobacter sp.]|nr:hypothetical protein [Candidatus Sulfotelmatobacter sp.]
MPVEYIVDIENRIVRTTFSGTITSRELREMLSRLAIDPSFSSEFSELAVFDQNCSLQLSFLDFKASACIDPFTLKSKRALVVGQSRAHYGVARMFQTARNDSARIRIFEDLNTALSWLLDLEEQAS